MYISQYFHLLLQFPESFPKGLKKAAEKVIRMTTPKESK
jgi:hypothetical protein